MKTLSLSIITVWSVLLSFLCTAKVNDRLLENYAQKLRQQPLLFTENKGQVYDHSGRLRNDVLFTGHKGVMSFCLTTAGIDYQFTKAVNDKNTGENVRVKTHRFSLELVGASKTASIIKLEKSNYTENFFNGMNTGGITGVASYEKVVYKEVYPNIDWVVYSAEGHIKYDFVVRPGGNPDQIRLKIKDADKVSITNGGELLMKTRLGEVNEAPPVSFADGKSIPTKFRLYGSNIIGFDMAAYPANATLTIDPSVSWTTYYGGSGNEQAYGCVTDASGNVYLSGTIATNASSLASGGYQLIYGGGTSDAFLVKFRPDGTRAWATYYGGTGNETTPLCAADNSGNVYLCGGTTTTVSASIATAGAFQTAISGTSDVFLAKFDASGARLWSTYYGANNAEGTPTCAVDASDNVYLSGTTNVTGTPTTNIASSGGYRTTPSGTTGNDLFIAKFNSSGARQWGTYFGGTGNEVISYHSCAVDNSGNVYLCGSTPSTLGVATTGTYGGGTMDGFLAKFNTSLSGSASLLWCKYFGGELAESTVNCTVDNTGNVYLSGSTASLTGIASSATVAQNTYGGGTADAFLAKFATGGILLWSTYYGGSLADNANACATASDGSVYISGSTASTSAVATGGFQNVNGGSTDALIVKFNSAGALQWGSYLGGPSADAANAIAVSSTDTIFVGGFTQSTSGIATATAFQGTFGGVLDQFLSKISDGSATAATTIATGTVSGSLCASGASINVPFTATGTFAAGNIFTAQLSDAAGSFASPLNIGTLTSTTSGTIMANIPASATGGSGYRIRVVNSSTIGTDNGTNLTVTPQAGTISGPLTLLPGQIITVTVAGAGTGGVWSSTSSSVASINASTGVVTAATTAAAYSTTDTSTIQYAVAVSGCGTVNYTTRVTVKPAFTPRNLVVFQVAGTTDAAGAVSLLEYTTTGSTVNTVVLPSSGTVQITAGASRVSEGQMSLDAEQTNLIVPGYDAPAGTASPHGQSSATYKRELFIVDPLKTSTLAYKQDVYSFNDINGGTANGANYYASGLGGNGIMFMNTPASVYSNNFLRNVQIFNGQLYCSGQSPAGISALGSGIPTTSATATLLNMSGLTGASPFAFAISPDGNTLYIADDAAGIFKYSKVAGTFVFQYKVTTTNCRGLTVDFTTSPYILYATTAASPANSIIKMTDNGASSPITALATAISTNNFRGVSFTPSPFAKIKVTTPLICSGNLDSVIIYANPGSTVTYSNGTGNLSVTIDATGMGVIGVSPTSTTTYSLVSIATSVGTFLATGSATITVNPGGAPAITTIHADPTVCAGNTLHLNTAVTSGITPYTYTWSGPGGFSASTASSATTNSANATSMPAAPANPVYTLSVVDANGCSATGINTVTTTVGSPTIYTVTGTGGYCTGGTGIVIGLNGSQSGTNYQLYNGATPVGSPVAGTGSAVGFAAVTAAATYSVTGTDGTSGCSIGMSGTAAVTILPRPAILSISGESTLCAGTGLHLTSSISATSPSYAYTWNGPSSYSNSATSTLLSNSLTITSVPATPTTQVYTLIVTDANGCEATGVNTVTTTINPSPNAGTISGAASLIPGQISTLTSSGDAGGTWSVGTPTFASVSAGGVITGLSAGSTTVSYSLSTGSCSVSATFPVVVSNAFASANIVVLKQNGNSTSSASVSLIEYTTAGTAVSAVNFPTASGNVKLTQAPVGHVQEQGFMTLDAEGTHIIVAGFDTTAGVAGVTTIPGLGVRKEILSVLPSKAYSRVSVIPGTTLFCYDDYSSATAAGSVYYGAGCSTGTPTSAGTQLMGATANTQVSSTPNSTRVSGVFNGQLYTSSVVSSPGIYQVGTGTPTASATSTLITSGGGSSPYAFAISPDSKTMYVADDVAGIQKFTQTGSTYNFSYNVTTTACRGLTADFTTVPYTIYATTAATPINAVIKVADNGAGSSVTTLATGTTSVKFKGVVPAPSSKAGITTNATTLCSGNPDTVTFYGNPGSVINYTRHAIAASITINSTGVGFTVDTLPATTTYSLVSIVTSLGTFTASGSITVTVNPSPVVSAVSAATAICAGSNLTLVSAISSGTAPYTYTWSGPSGYSSSTVSSLTNVSVTVSSVPATPVTQVYSMTVADVNSCVATGINTVTTVVSVAPSAVTATASGSSLCTGASLTLTGTATGATSYSWSGPDAYSATILNPASLTVSTLYTGIYTLSAANMCGTVTATTASVTVNDYPSAYNVTGGNGCSAAGLSVGLDGSQSSVVNYLLKRLPSTTVATFGGTTAPFSFATVSVPGVYKVVAVGPGGCQSDMQGADTLNQSPAISLGTIGSICQPSTSLPVSFSGVAGSPTVYGIDWDAPANAAGFADFAGATLSGSSVTLIIPSAGTPGTFNGSLTVSDGLCASAVYPVSVSVYTDPATSVTSVSQPCSGYAGNIDFSGSSGTIVDYSIDGGTPVSFTFTGVVHSLSTGVITAPHTYYMLGAHNPACSAALTDTIAINPILMTWLGGSSDWNDVANWSCGFVPTVSDDVTIGAATFGPSIAVSGTVRNIKLNPGSALDINGGAELAVSGTLTNNSTVSGAGKVVLNNTSYQTIKGKGTINNLELNNSAGATIDTGSRIVISNTLYITAGTLTTNDSLELASGDSLSTARIAALPASGGSISGKVKVDQYVQGHYRRYRFWSHPFNSSLSLSQVQRYIDITGPGGAGSGFTSTASNAPSAFRLDPYTENDTMGYDPGWKPFTKINASAADSNKIKRYQGIRLFFRGAKGEGLGYLGYYGMYDPAEVTVKMSGNINQGPQTVFLAQGAANPLHQSFNMIGNPYPSPVDIGTVLYYAAQTGNVQGAAFYVWDPTLGAGGNFVTIPIGTSSPIPYNIAANTCFQVRAGHDGDSLNFVESDKAAVYDNYLFKMPSDYLTLSIYDSNYHLWDALRIQFNDNVTEAEENKYDAVKPMGTDFTFYSLSSDKRKLAIDARPFGNERVIPLGISSAYDQQFIIRADNVVMPSGSTIFLHDKLLDRYIEMNAGAEYSFAVSRDKATQGDARFELSMKPVTGKTADDGLHVNMLPNPATDEVNITFTTAQKEQTSVSVMNLSGVSIYSKDLGVRQSGTVSISLSNQAPGIYMVELTAGDKKVVQRLVKE
ncbi:hypothetical protein CJD36_011120 [Flavipsychrobacter stenotrophus]|uniref:Uncharacterized protein n=1 Tax=Flavipsychrobacter stenotrophus TaxID=2077091 RepID=A0A2S7SUC6_9BACT|nr:SBBP repeat-containing protein [Flavipsychrobacter stenotrophus]PQJ10519.1 hypothetical protein CJD36_011120 [Flavipsychrobacter stenotrophus]